ncbi:MAG: hypothetical protein HY964_08880 [Ignavibacteriales bacterium]|nr:hypothetical protein [Ignavibacteriales bacterium]
MFSPRTPEKPTSGTSAFQPPVTPEIVLENFSNAITSSNVDNYMRCFVDTSASDFAYVFLPSGNFQGLFQSWTLGDERRYFQNLGKPLYSVPVLTLTNLNSDRRTSTSVEFTMNYLLIYPHQRPNVSNSVQGYLRLYLSIDDQQRWGINKWEDTKTVTDSTWSYLKYNLNY